MPLDGHLDDGAQQTARLLRAHPALRRDAPAGCLDAEALAAFVSGGAGARQAETLAHLTTCARCRHAVAALSRVLADDRVAAEAWRKPARWWSRRASWTAGLAAAAAVAALLLWPRTVEEPGTEGGNDFREPPTTAVGAPDVIAPRGRVATVPMLVWSRVPRANRYRLRLFDTTSAVLWEGEVTDTLAILPASVGLAPGASYFWKVEAKTGRNRWVASDLVQFTIAPSGP